MSKTDKKDPIVIANRPRESSPLLTIQQKEIEISAGILNAKRQAEETVAKARMKAIEIREAAEKEGSEQAMALNKKEIAKAKKQAEKKMGSVDDLCDEVRDLGEQKEDKAVSYIVSVVTGRAN